MSDTTLDKVLVLASMLMLSAFCLMMVIWVGVPDLLVAMAGVLALAFYDFWITVFKPRPGPARMRDDLEERPGGVSGKTVVSEKELRK